MTTWSLIRHYGLISEDTVNLSSIINVFIITIPLSEHLRKAERCTKMAAGKQRAVTGDDSSTCKTKGAHYRRAEETRRSCYYARHVVHCQTQTHKYHPTTLPVAWTALCNKILLRHVSSGALSLCNFTFFFKAFFLQSTTEAQEGRRE